MPAKTFLELARRAAFSEEGGGWVGSQYEERLLAGDDGVGTIGLYGCGRLVGAMSWGEHALPRGGVSGRIDLVVTEPACRGRGIGTLVMATFIQQCGERHGAELGHFSVIAQHPAIGHTVRRWGFEPADCGNAPLYQIGVDSGRRAAVRDRARHDARERLNALKMDCLACKRHAWTKPWCVGEDAA